MAINLFSTYKTGENRVTASILAVLRALSIGRLERILGALLGQGEFELIEFANQSAKGGSSVPDARIFSSLHLLLETKVRPNSVRASQLKAHLKQFEGNEQSHEALIVLTPDSHEPKAITNLADPRVTWTSFVALDQAIDELLVDPTEVVSEREAFLLRELQAMLLAENLVRIPGLVVVVAAKRAWPRYLEHPVYICQAGRSFRRVEHMAFYADGKIQPLIPQILEVHDPVKLRWKEHSGDLGDAVRFAIKEKWQNAGSVRQVVLLSGKEDSRTLTLDEPISNDLRTSSGQAFAFTMGQRYVELDRLKEARMTSDLVGD